MVEPESKPEDVDPPADDAPPPSGQAEASTGSNEQTKPARRVRSSRSPAAKRQPKKTTASSAKNGKRTTKPARTPSAPAPKYPRHALEKALRLPKALYEQNAGKPATRQEAVRFAGGSAVNGPWSVEISSSLKYGFLESSGGQLALTERARRAIAPQSEVDRLAALREAIQDAPDFSEVYNYYRGEHIPELQYYTNALVDRFKIPQDKVGEFQQLFDESLRYAELVDDSGPQPKLLDVGRVDDRPMKRPTTKASPQALVASGSTCFVMQPFSDTLGTYYEKIFKPAIIQAGLQPIRADADIFATGKIIDQIWRGINAATILVAELTTKNPNVFYELGLAHALRKPVVLVSSNEEDIPFDLRHIRVIVYDQTDPFWGQKLIDKVAENIKSAIDDPEEAIFRIDDSGR